MDDAEKRRIAEVIAGAMGKQAADFRSFVFALVDNDGSAWWQVIDWTRKTGWFWFLEPHHGWGLVTKVGSFDSDDRSERWARLSCVAQAIEAGAFK